MSSEHVERRLAAILAADVAGSCRLIGIDEEGTLAQLKALRKTLFDPKVSDHRGRIVKNTGDGALVVFEGIVREHSRGKQVRALVYEAYGSMAQKQIEQLAEEAARRWPITNLAVVHRTGTLQVGEVSVVIAVGAPHRGEAFDACEWLIDELKRTVPIWKKEIYTEGEAWVDDRP